MDLNKHSINLENRSLLTLDGITDVVSFDDNNVILDTNKGRLNVSGTDLHIKTLCLESGDVVVEGSISELIYEDDDKQVKKGFFGRIRNS